jgi:hypothetical protein
MSSEAPIELVVVIPTYCERDNLPELMRRLRQTLAGIEWEAIVVDDDSPDAFINLVIANQLFSRGTRWTLASLAGIMVGAVWNYAVTSRFAWGQRRSAPSSQHEHRVKHYFC